MHRKMWFCDLAQIFSALATLSFVDGYFNLDEVQEVNYDLNFDNAPYGFEDFKLDSSVRTKEDIKKIVSKLKPVVPNDAVTMVSEFGQSFVCTLPQIPEKKEESPKKHNLTISLVSDVVAASFYVQQCIQKSLGWWSYELCYNKQIKQFHLEGAVVTGKLLLLGKFKNDSGIKYKKIKDRKQLYFEQVFDDGSICDVTGAPRQTRVWYFCDEALSTSEAFIATVDEPTSCEYIMRVHSGSLCKLEPFLDTSRPRKPLPIICRPILDQEGAQKYIEGLVMERQRKEEARRKADVLAVQAESIQRQRFARKRLALKTPKGEREAKYIESALKYEYDRLMKSISELSLEALKVKADLHFIYDDLDEMESNYATEEDADRANLHWYFYDKYWDRKFFPMTHSYVRMSNNYFWLMTAFLSKFNEEYDESVTTLTNFLKGIDDGEVTEAHLSLLIGPLRDAFQERKLPDIVENFDGQSMMLHKKMWTSDKVLSKRTNHFEEAVLKMLREKIKFDPIELMSKVARQILTTKAMLKNMNRENEQAGRFTYVEAEKIFSRFEESYDRAIKRYEEETLTFEVLLKMNTARDSSTFGKIMQPRIERRKIEKAKLKYSEDFIDQHLREKMLEDIDSKDFIIEEARIEYIARTKMLQRSKRKNLRKNVEKYLRSIIHPHDKAAKKGSLTLDELDGLKTQLLAFKTTLEEKLRETIADGAEVRVQLISPVDGLLGGEGLQTFEEERVNAILKALLAEQDNVVTEDNRYERLREGYTFGASEELKEKAARKDDDEEDEMKSSVLPSLKRLLS